MPAEPRVEGLAGFKEHVRQQLRRNYDVLALITGRPGVGKSHLANYLAHQTDPTFTVRGRTFWSGKSLIWGSERAPRYSTVVWDEIVEGGLAIEAITGENRDVLKHLITGRSLNLFTIACAPTLKLFQGFTKEDRAAWWIHMPRRGEAIFHRVSNDNPYPRARTFYPQAFILEGFPAMDDAELTLYEKLKLEWRTKWHRDSDRYLGAMDAKEAEDMAVRKLKKSLAWLPASVDAYASTFPNHKGKLAPWEQRVRTQLHANKGAPDG